MTILSYIKYITELFYLSVNIYSYYYICCYIMFYTILYYHVYNTIFSLTNYLLKNYHQPFRPSKYENSYYIMVQWYYVLSVSTLHYHRTDTVWLVPVLEHYRLTIFLQDKCKKIYSGNSSLFKLLKHGRNGMNELMLVNGHNFRLALRIAKV